MLLLLELVKGTGIRTSRQECSADGERMTDRTANICMSESVSESTRRERECVLSCSFFYDDALAHMAFVLHAIPYQLPCLPLHSLLSAA